jgi:hypothetical protein
MATLATGLHARFGRTGLAPAGLYQEVSPSHLQFPLFQVLPSAIFTVPTLRFQILYIFVILNHSRRQVVHFAVTAHPTHQGRYRRPRETGGVGTDVEQSYKPICT